MMMTGRRCWLLSVSSSLSSVATRQEIRKLHARSLSSCQYQLQATSSSSLILATTSSPCPCCTSSSSSYASSFSSLPTLNPEKKIKIRKRFGPPVRVTDAAASLAKKKKAKGLTLTDEEELALTSASSSSGTKVVVPIQNQYSEREKIMLEGVDWSAALWLVGLPIAGVAFMVMTIPELKNALIGDRTFRSRQWEKDQVIRDKEKRDERKAQRQVEEKAKREEDLYEQEKQTLLLKQQEKVIEGGGIVVVGGSNFEGGETSARESKPKIDDNVPQ